MADTSQILKLLASCADVKRLSDAIRHRKSDIQVTGLVESATALVCAVLRRSGGVPGTMLCVMDDEETAAYFYHDLTQMLGDDGVMFFPSSYKRAIKYNQRDEANEILRTNVLTRLSTPSAAGQDNGIVIVAYPESLAEMVVAKDELTEHSLTINLGDMLDVTELEERLFALGFVRADYVYEPGQFAMRGSIVDVFSFSNDLPYRLDFFGDEVDSIRTFDIQTQLSEGKTDSLTIVPEPSSSSRHHVSFLSFLPDDTLVMLPSADYVAGRIEQIASAGFSVQAHVVSDAPLDTGFLATRKEFEAEISGFRCVNLGHTGEQSTAGSKLSVSFHTSAQPLFHKNFELVTQEFERLISEGYSINIFADNEKQVRRLEDIFDANRHGEMMITFAAVPRAIHEGFIDHTLRQCFFTDHQLFDRYHKYSLKSERVRRGKVALTLKELQQFEIGDYVVHIDHGIGRFGGLVRVPNGD